ncbi:hypothetical protein [Paraburkholderia phosphatilytica]|nr:hypothetical protein [Paraburkholderia phosphatilytica]
MPSVQDGEAAPKNLTIADPASENRDENITTQPGFAGSLPVNYPETPHL